MIKKMGYRWNLRKLMAAREISPPPIWFRCSPNGAFTSPANGLPTGHQPPQRLTMDTFAALYDILDVGGQQDLIEVPPTALKFARPPARRKRSQLRRFGGPRSAAPTGNDATNASEPVVPSPAGHRGRPDAATSRREPGAAQHPNCGDEAVTGARRWADPLYLTDSTRTR